MQMIWTNVKHQFQLLLLLPAFTAAGWSHMANYWRNSDFDSLIYSTAMERPKWGGY